MLWILLSLPVMLLPELILGTHSLSYMKSIPKGDFFVAEGKELSEADTTLKISVPNLCTCRSACFVSPECQAVSLIQVSSTPVEKYECLIANKGPADSTLVHNINATYLFWKASISSLFHDFKDDGLLYLVPDIDDKDVFSAKSFCAKIPGYRLAMLKTLEQYNALREIHTAIGGKALWVDVTTDNNVDATWGDGTPYSSDLPQINADNLKQRHLRFTHGELHDIGGKTRYGFLCQADPIRGKW